MKKLLFSGIFKTLLFCLALTSGAVFAQNQNNFWFFGSNAGMNFNGGAPVPVLGGALNTTEGCVTLSDAATGNLLFLSDGQFVWNRNQVQMPNGFGLMGNGSTSQSGLGVKLPGSANIYYLFTCDVTGSANGIRYSKIDMSLNGGLGDVIVKNIPVFAPTTEQLCIVRHANCIDSWIIGRDYGGQNYRAFLLTTAGLSAVPVISNIGTAASGADAIGYLKASEQGDRLACAKRYQDIVELYDFNNTTGVVSNLRTLTNLPYSYAAEFSADDTKLYVNKSNPTLLFQYDLSQPTAALLNSTRIQVGAPASNWGGALQMGPDGKIYHACFFSGVLGVINNPNAAGLACNFVDNGFNLGGPQSTGGLPNHQVCASNCTVANFSFTNTCFGDSTTFINTSTGPIQYYQWYFDDIPSGVNDSSHLISPKHYFGSMDTFDVKLVVVDSVGNTDSLVRQVIITPYAVVNIGNDTMICQGNFVTLDAGNPGAHFLWSNGDTTQTTTIGSTGLVSVIANYGTCYDYDTLMLIVLAPNVNLGPDVSICVGQSVTLDAGNPGTHYLWSGGDTTQLFSPTVSGIYWAISSLSQCADTDSISVTFIPLPTTYLGNDSLLCAGQSLQLDAGTSAPNYLWSTGATTQIITVNTTGDYSVVLTSTSAGCTATDLAHITFQPLPVVAVNDTSVCPGSEIILDAQNPGSTYLWSTGATTQQIEVHHEEHFNVVVTTGICTSSDSAYVHYFPENLVSVCCSGDLILGLSTTLTAAGASMYTWTPESSILCGGICQTDVVAPVADTWYFVQGVRSDGCVEMDSVFIDVIDDETLFIPNAFNPNGNSTNSKFSAVGLQLHSGTMSIYDRWGNEVYKTSDLTAGWDGTSKGAPAPQGVYIYVLKGKWTSGRDFSQVGSLSLLR